MTALPYSNTTIPATKSIGDIMELLQDVGFEKTAQLYDNGRHIVMGQYKGIQYRWEARIEGIHQAVLPKRYTGGPSRRRKTASDYEIKARRIAWRVLWHQIKVACDIIKYEVQDVSEVFGGNLVYIDPEHGETTLAKMITRQAEAGVIQLPQIEAPK